MNLIQHETGMTECSHWFADPKEQIHMCPPPHEYARSPWQALAAARMASGSAHAAHSCPLPVPHPAGFNPPPAPQGRFAGSWRGSNAGAARLQQGTGHAALPFQVRSPPWPRWAASTLRWCSLSALAREVRFGTAGRGNTHGKSNPRTARLCLSRGPACTTAICVLASAFGGSAGGLKAEEQNVSFRFVACACAQGQQEARPGLSLAFPPQKREL